jgi:murein DD-endopeptidase MepM/ murein hydrolase activator NlpD
MTNPHRDLAAPEVWIRSLERSRRRRELLPKARRENNRRKHVSAALATAMVAGPGAPLAAAQVSGDLSAEVAAESPANRAIEIREGGLPLQVGSQGELVAHVQRALHVTADGIFGVQTDAAVRSYQQAAGLEVDGIVGLATWGSLFESQTANGASLGGSNVPPEVKQRVEQRLELAGQELAAQGGTELGAPDAGTTTTDTTTSTPVPTGRACGSATISSPVHGTVTSDFGPRGGRNHDGIDIAAPTGTPVRAAACGTVSMAGQQSGYGNIVCITHTSQFSTCYAHLSRFGVTNGAQVQQGQVIGYVGCTGSCTGPHLHFETRVGGQARDPQPYLGGASMPSSSANTTQQASATSASTTGSASSTSTQATVTEAGTSSTTAVDSLEPSTTTETATTGTATIGTTTEAAPTAAPTEAAPASTAPAEPVPASTAPAEPVPASTAPAEPVPASTAPAEAAPATTVPAEPVPTSTVPAPAAPTTDATVAGTGTVADGTLTGSTETDATVTGTVPTAPAEERVATAPAGEVEGSAVVAAQ